MGTRPKPTQTKRTRRRPASGKRPSAERRPYSILEAEWDGLSVDELRAECLADHRKRKKDPRRYINPWDYRLVCRYVLRGMVCGETESVLLAPLKIEYAQFMRILKIEFLDVEYAMARKLQGRAFADHVDTISRGADAASQSIAVRIDTVLRNEFRRAIRRSKKHRNAYKLAQEILEVKRGIQELDRNLIARNRLMMDSKKWLAKTNDPERYGESSKVQLTPPNDPDGNPLPLGITVRFVSPSGKAITRGGKST